MSGHKKPDAAKKVAKKESGHKANKEGAMIPKAGKGPDEKAMKMFGKAVKPGFPAKKKHKKGK